MLLYLFFPSLARFFTFSCVYSISFTCLSIIFLYLFCCLFSWFLYVYSFWSSVNQEVLNQTSFHVRLFGGGWNMTSRKGKQGKQPPPPFSSQVMAALGREVQSNFGQQNSAAVALISSDPMLHPESRWMKCQQPGLNILKKLQGFHYFSLELIWWGHVTMHVHSPHRLLQTSKKVPVEEGRACHQKY